MAGRMDRLHRLDLANEVGDREVLIGRGRESMLCRFRAAKLPKFCWTWGILRGKPEALARAPSIMLRCR
jgi:hypothetical protein